MEFRNPYKDHIIINALMRGGIVPEEVCQKLSEWVGVGYNTCFDCLEGRSSLCHKPPVKKHLENVAAFFGADAAEHTFGARGAQFAVMRTIAEFVIENEDYCPTIIIDPNSHYSTNIAAEMCGLETIEPPHSGYPEYLIDGQDFQKKIEETKSREGKLPGLVVVTHADPYYGNIAEVEEIGRICEGYEVPLMVNAAYTGGVMPINIHLMKADFLTLSAHKSMMSVAPLGYVVTTYKWAKRLFATSEAKPSWSGRRFGKKIPNIFGCSIGGLPLISSMLSFDYVQERVKHWDEELIKINKFVDDLEELGDIMLLGQRPHQHHLLHFETPKFWEISQHHRKKGFFLADGMIERGIVGLHRGMSKHIKLSVYGLSNEEIEKVKEAFYEIAKT
ncbi:aminotransferase class V-fold PLP-dependent enzyme [bacterium]|nr:aminotransferase class V-fold PLP-dependent enzyme [bacterium]MBU1599429.1 aminotransferase class V-fold PLP-dependent enzyme [bacterium]